MAGEDKLFLIRPFSGPQIDTSTSVFLTFGFTMKLSLHSPLSLQAFRLRLNSTTEFHHLLII